MARLSMAQPVSADELDRLSPAGRVTVTTRGIWAHRPEVAAAWRVFGQTLADTGQLPRRLVELVRLRIAFHTQCRSCMALRYSDAIDDGLTEDLVCALERPYEAPDLTEAERIALRYADLFATNHLAIDDDLLDELRKHFDEGSVVELGIQCARMVGFGRLTAIFGIFEDLPGRLGQDLELPYTPWESDVLVMPSQLSRDVPGED
jgi:AhpD family alkylhydroperoxidase